MDSLFYPLTVVRSRGISDIVDAVSSRPADDLFDFPIGEGTPFKAVIFYGLHQDDTSDGKVHAHADGICGDHHIGLARSEKLRLFVPHVIGKSAVDNAAADVFFPELGRHGVDISPGKNDQGIPRLYIVREDEFFFLVFKRRHPPVVDDFIFISAVFDDLHKSLFRLRGRADIHSIRADSHDGRCPGAAAGPVRDHLRFIDHCHFVAGL